MKNNQNCRRALTCVAVMCLILAMIMSTISILRYYVVSLTRHYFYNVNTETGEIVGNWNYLGLFTALILLMVIAWEIKTFMFTIPSVKGKGKSCYPLMCFECIVLVGFFACFIGTFLPFGTLAVDYATAETPRIVASNIMSWLGLPMTLMGVIGTFALSYKASK